MDLKFNSLVELRNAIIGIMKAMETNVAVVNLKIETFFISECDTAVVTMDKRDNSLNFYTLKGKHATWLSTGAEMPNIVDSIEINSITTISEFKIEREVIKNE